MTVDKQQIALERVRIWAAEEMVGLPASASSLRYFESNAKRIVSETLDVDYEAVQLENLRYEEGGALKLDGFKIDYP